MWEVGNEFAKVRLRLDGAGHDPRVVVEDVATGAWVVLDAMMLAGIVRRSRAEIDRVMDPGDD